MLARLTAFAVWALVAATAVFWGLRLLVQPTSAPPYTVSVGDGTVLKGDLARLFGATPAVAAPGAPVQSAPELASRFKLLGIMAGKPSAQATAVSGPGFALIAVDGKPARAYPVGAALDGELVLQAVSLRTASIGPVQGTTAVTLEIPPLAAAATGTLPPAGGAAPVSGAVTLPPSMPPQGMPGADANANAASQTPGMPRQGASPRPPGVRVPLPDTGGAGTPPPAATMPSPRVPGGTAQ